MAVIHNNKTSDTISILLTNLLGSKYSFILLNIYLYIIYYLLIIKEKVSISRNFYHKHYLYSYYLIGKAAGSTFSKTIFLTVKSLKSEYSNSASKSKPSTGITSTL